MAGPGDPRRTSPRPSAGYLETSGRPNGGVSTTSRDRAGVPDRRCHEMRVVYLNPVGEVGGAELSLLDLMASVAEAVPGVERHLIVAGDGQLIGKAEAPG